MFVKVSILGVLAVVKDLGSKEYQPRRREEKKRKHKNMLMCGIMFVKVSVISVLAVVKDLGKKINREDAKRKKKAAQEGAVARDYDCKG
jgi:F0F1-type ATP synthase epsilon subunit